MKPILLKSRLFPLFPPSQSGNSGVMKSNLAKFKNKAGCYMIYKNDKLCYVGFSGYDLATTCYRHFYSWNDNAQARVSYKGFISQIKIRVIITTPTRAQKLEKALIIKYNPTDNPNKYKGDRPTKTESDILTAAEHAEITGLNTNVWEEAPF